MLIGGAIWTFKEELDTFNHPMTLFFNSIEKNTGISSELPLKYLEPIVCASLAGLILGATQMLIGFKSGGYLTLLFYSFLAVVREYPGWKTNEQEIGNFLEILIFFLFWKL